MTDYTFPGFLAWDPVLQQVAPGAVFTMVNASGAAVSLKSIGGSAISAVTADSNGFVAPFIAVDASVGSMVASGNPGLTQPLSSTWAQDPAQVASTIKSYSDSAAASASQAATTVGSLTPALNSLTGRVSALEQGGTGGASKVPGTKTPITIFASDYGNAWPSPIRLTADASYSVTFVGSIAQPPAVAAGSDQGMQPGDFYYYVGT